jgi:hypothetical protein
MKLKDAVEKSIRQYYNGVLPDQAIEASSEEFIWTLEEFDKLKDPKKEAKNAKSK